MRLRPRQKTFVKRSIHALREHHNTLAVAPTGAGKTVMFSEVAGQLIKKVSPSKATPKIDATELPSGMYILKIIANDYLSFEKVVKL